VNETPSERIQDIKLKRYLQLGRSGIMTEERGGGGNANRKKGGIRLEDLEDQFEKLSPYRKVINGNSVKKSQKRRRGTEL